ncbi:MAG: type 1 glutamine amidotransferase [Nitrospinaceae bacterium]|nr:type 1 glutamine amidotransferase [Nitrospinaceae bacterium]
MARGWFRQLRALVLQHISVEHPGIFRDFLADDGIIWDVVELDEGERIPSLEGYDVLFVMGGPMDVWEEDTHPWLVAEKAVICEWVRQDKPFLGFCLGHQLLAAALGGEVGPTAAPEVGIMDVSLTLEGLNDPLFSGLSESLTCMQWHSAAVSNLPPGAVTLASSEVCPIQAFRIGSMAYGLQFHIEITDTTAKEWGCVPEYQKSLQTVLGAGALTKLTAEIDTALPILNKTARQLYVNFMTLIR